MNFPEKTLYDLEWHRLLDQLARRCTGEEAAEGCRDLPFPASDEARQHLCLVKELMECINEGDPPPSLPARPMGEWLARIRGQGSVPKEALRDVAVNLKLFVAIARYLDNRRDGCSENAAAVLPKDSSISLIGLARLSAEIESSFEPDGTIADGASPSLGQLRHKVVSLRKHLVSRIEKIAETEDDLLQERTITIRNDRFVLPVRADAHRRLSGIVHGASGSGATVFVEPEQIIETGNELMLAREEVAREEARILAALSQAVRDEYDDVEYANKTIVEVEIRIAAARLSIDLKASVPLPSETGSFELIGARHPLLLLEGVDVVPSNFTGHPGESIVISGPNAGGKTVILKTIGLLGLMLARGLPIPADSNSHLGIPQKVLTDIGDEQSLLKNLSTFSAHMTNIAFILKEAGRNSLVLLDELAAGTDPGEGAALAEAFLEQLNNQGATTLTTTHFDSLKVRAHTGDDFVNAAMGFDMAEMQPTFKLRIGSPGSSSAMAVASRFGAPEKVIARARAIMPGSTRELAKAVEALDKEQHKLLVERESLKAARRSLEEAKRRHRDELAHLKSKQSDLIDKEAKALWSAIRTAREKVRDAESSIKKRRRIVKEDVTRARKAINQVASDLDPGGKLSWKDSDELPGKPATEADITQGAKVYVKTLGASGVVESTLKSGQAFVLIGNIKTRVRLRDMHIVESSKPKKQKPKKVRSRIKDQNEGASPEYKPEPVKTSENTVDLRGMTSDEAIDATDGFLDTALRQDWPSVYILHGHGKGALKSAIRTYLKESNYVSDFRPGEREEGGDGITVAWLR